LHEAGETGIPIFTGGSHSKALKKRKGGALENVWEATPEVYAIGGYTYIKGRGSRELWNDVETIGGGPSWIPK